MLVLPEPTVIHPQAPLPPSGNVLTRALKAVLVERRMPYSARCALDAFMMKIGFQEKTIRTSDGLYFRVRRCHDTGSGDEAVVQDVVEEKRYLLEVKLPPDATVIDIGGNIGAFAVLAAKLAPAGQVISIEPEQGNLALLKTNVLLNNVADRVTVINGAVVGGSVLRKVQLSVSSNGGAYHSTATLLESNLRQTVDGYPLDAIFENTVGRCNLLKLDCEGAEYEIFEGFSYWSCVDAIVMEYHAQTIAYKRNRGDWLVKKFKENGFHIVRYTDEVGFRSGHIVAVR